MAVSRWYTSVLYISEYRKLHKSLSWILFQRAISLFIELWPLKCWPKIPAGKLLINHSGTNQQNCSKLIKIAAPRKQAPKTVQTLNLQNHAKYTTLVCATNRDFRHTRAFGVCVLIWAHKCLIGPSSIFEPDSLIHTLAHYFAAVVQVQQNMWSTAD